MTARRMWHTRIIRKQDQYTVAELRSRLAHETKDRRIAQRALREAEGILDQVRDTDHMHAEDEWHALQGKPRDDESDSMLDGRVADLLQALQDRGEL